MVSFLNPLGLLGLLGIPAVLAIHMLQRKAVHLPVSTLFLLEKTQRDTQTGRRIDRIASSLPLWMQLLAVLLLTWFIAEPRFQKTGSVQRIAIVLDSSASMGVFKKEAIIQIEESIPRLKGKAATVEFTLLESAANRPRLYAGTNTDELKSALEKWQALDGLTDPSQALRLARSLVSRDGVVIYLTDTPAQTLPFQAQLIAVGTTIENVGFTGVSFSNEEGKLIWKALVRNYSDQAVERTWKLQTASGSSEPRNLRLEPKAIVTLQAAFPSDAKHVRVVLSPDRFTLDDTLPIVAPKPKALDFFPATSPAFADFRHKLLRTFEHASFTDDASKADITIATYDVDKSSLPSSAALIFVEEKNRQGSYLKGNIIAERHPLVDGINWQSLIIRDSAQLPRSSPDQVLVWQDQRPLIFLRETPAAKQLCFNFDPRHSNIENQSAFVVLLHRFAESIREAKVSPYSINLETGQAIKVATVSNVPVVVKAIGFNEKPITAEVSLHRTPQEPCFLTVQQGQNSLLDAAVFFADTREADFSACNQAEQNTSTSKTNIEQHTQPDPLWRVWILILLAALLVSWKSTPQKVPA